MCMHAHIIAIISCAFTYFAYMYKSLRCDVSELAQNNFRFLPRAMLTLLRDTWGKGAGTTKRISERYMWRGIVKDVQEMVIPRICL